jgi:AraC-like DNA-binding protein
MAARPASPAHNLHFRNTAGSPVGGITLAGFSVRQTASMKGNRVFGQYAVVYILEGEGRYEDRNGYRRHLVPGDVVLVFPELSHCYNPDTVWVCSYLCFVGAAFDVWRQEGLLDATQPIHHAEPLDAWHRRFQEVLGQPAVKTPASSLLEVCRLLTLLSEIASGAGGRAHYEDDVRWMHLACSRLEALPPQERDWGDLASQLGMTAEAFRKRFTRLVGQPPARYRARRLIDRACRLMQDPRLPDKRIAEELGFCDEFYFSRRFKQATGHSPREFRQHFLQASKG